jgi:hypothetical protein
MASTPLITLSLTGGRTIDVPCRWRGRCLTVHPPVRTLDDGTAAHQVTAGVWVITAQPSGLSAGTYHGPLAGAKALARAWDAAFAQALDGDPAANLSRWPQSPVWAAQLRGDQPPTGPDPAASAAPATQPRVSAADGDGAEQFPATPTLVRAEPGRIRFSRTVNGKPRLIDQTTGNPCRMNGDVAAFKGPDPLTPVLRLWFRGCWYDIPTVAEVMEWTLDSVCPTPDGRTVEPDAPDSWLSLLQLV